MAIRFSLSTAVLINLVIISLLLPGTAYADRHSHHHARKHAVQSARVLVNHSHRHGHRREVETAVEDSRQLRLKSRRERRLEARRAYEAHLERLAADSRPTKWERIEEARAYRAHLERIAANRREALAEMNGEISSKSIRAFQTYIASVPIRMVTVDLNDPTVKVSGLLAQNGIGSAEPFSKMIRRTQPDVAVTGTFFSLDNLKPVGDIVINGDLAYFGGMGTALCITRNNRAQMITVPWGHHHDWSDYDFVMACGPRLLDGGHIVLDPSSERFRDKNMLAPNSRIGVGITPTNKLVFVMTQKPIYLGRLAKIMRAIGCTQAMNLDAGTSTGFYCDGNMMARPGRWLTNAIVVYANQHPSQPSAS